MVFRPSADVGEVVLSGEKTEKGQGENACRGLISAALGTRIANLTENLGKMGKIVLHGNPCMIDFVHFLWLVAIGKMGVMINFVFFPHAERKQKIPV
jgi:hypothetical protein